MDVTLEAIRLKNTTMDCIGLVGIDWDLFGVVIFFFCDY